MMCVPDVTVSVQLTVTLLLVVAVTTFGSGPVKVALGPAASTRIVPDCHCVVTLFESVKATTAR